MFPNQYSDFQGIPQVLAFYEMQRTWAEIKGTREHEHLLMQLIWFCLGKLGSGLSMFGRLLEQTGQRITWFVMRQKVESTILKQ